MGQTLLCHNLGSAAQVSFFPGRPLLRNLLLKADFIYYICQSVLPLPQEQGFFCLFPAISKTVPSCRMYSVNTRGRGVSNGWFQDFIT
jgi:hypothetical protein